jgi:hypothetical protein
MDSISGSTRIRGAGAPARGSICNRKRAGPRRRPPRLLAASGTAGPAPEFASAKRTAGSRSKACAARPGRRTARPMHSGRRPSASPRELPIGHGRRAARGVRQARRAGCGSHGAAAVRARPGSSRSNRKARPGGPTGRWRPRFFPAGPRRPSSKPRPIRSPAFDGRRALRLPASRRGLVFLSAPEASSGQRSRPATRPLRAKLVWSYG